MAASTMVDASDSTDGRRGGGRGFLPPVLAGVGALLFVLGLLVHFYIAPTLAVAPIDQNSITSLEGKGATIFDTDTLKPITTDLSVKAHTIGDVDASNKAGGSTLVWNSTTTITSADGVVRSQSTKRAAFDEVTAEAVNCCGSFNETEQGVQTPVTRSGLVFKFPFNTEKKTYQVWDDSLGKAVATQYKGTATVHGHTAWKFENDVPSTVVGTVDVPGSLFGEASNDNVTADSNYQNHNTYYVEPITGAIVNQVTETKSSYSYNGTELITTQATIAYTPKEIDETFDLLGNQPALLKLVQGFLPWLVAFGGLVLIAISVVMVRRQRV